MTELLSKPFIKKMREALETSQSFQELRAKAFDKALVQGKTEGHRQFPLKQLLAQSWKQSVNKDAESVTIEEDLDGVTLVFVDGHFSKELSTLDTLPEEMIVLPLSVAEKKFKTFLRSRFQKILKEENDFFSLLNLAFQGEGLFLYLPPELTILAPVHVVHHITQEQAQLMPRLHVHVGKESQLSLQMTTRADATSFWNNAEVDLTLEEGAKLTCVQSISENMQGAHLSHMRAHLKKEAELKIFSLNQSQGVTRESYVVTLGQEKAKASIKGLANLKGNAAAQTMISMHHAAPNTVSSQLFKAALDESAKHRFLGKVTMEKGAKKAEAEQRSHHLLLSKHAQAVATPRLHIHNHDVQASHGATVADIDENALFYLQSRGMPLELAKALLVKGFCGEILKQIERV